MPHVQRQALLAEDDPLIRELLTEMLLDHGFEVHGAASADDGAAQLKDMPRLDLLITDIEMPGLLNGWDLGARARKAHESLPIIYVSGAAAKRPILKDQYFVAKPFSVIDLMSFVDSLFDDAALARH